MYTKNKWTPESAALQSSFPESPTTHDTSLTRNIKHKNIPLLDAFNRFIYDELITNDRSQKTVDGYWWMVRSFIRAAGYINTSELTLEAYQKWREDMRERGTARSTVITNVSRFRYFVEYLNMRNLCPLFYRDIKPPKKRKPNSVYLTREEVDRMIAFSRNVRDKAILETLFSCGLRNQECRELRRTDVKGLDVHVQHGVKDGDDREVYLSSKGRQFLDAYLAARMDNSVYMFVTSKGQKIAESTFRYIIAYAGHRAGIAPEKCHPHAFRHGYGTHLKRGGMHTRDIQELLGHRYLSTTQLYVHSEERSDLKAKCHEIFMAG